jgi:hypothetical protein
VVRAFVRHGERQWGGKRKWQKKRGREEGWVERKEENRRDFQC